jgi:hypothetical protein
VLSGSCSAISSALATARVTASGLLTDADKAARQLAALDSKAQLVEEFLVKYQLTPEEVRMLRVQGFRVWNCYRCLRKCLKKCQVMWADVRGCGLCVRVLH